MTIQSLKTACQTTYAAAATGLQTAIQNLPHYLTDILLWDNADAAATDRGFKRLFDMEHLDKGAFDAVDHWIHRVLASAQGISDAGKAEFTAMLDADTLIGQVGLSNAFALISHGYMLAYRKLKAEKSPNAQSKNAFDIFQKQFQALMATYPKECREQITSKTLFKNKPVFDKSALGPEFIAHLNAAQKQSQALSKAAKIALGAFSAIALAGVGYSIYQYATGETEVVPGDTPVANPLVDKAISVIGSATHFVVNMTNIPAWARLPAALANPTSALANATDVDDGQSNPPIPACSPNDTTPVLPTMAAGASTASSFSAPTSASTATAQAGVLERLLAWTSENPIPVLGAAVATAAVGLIGAKLYGRFAKTTVTDIKEFVEDAEHPKPTDQYGSGNQGNAATSAAIVHGSSPAESSEATPAAHDEPVVDGMPTNRRLFGIESEGAAIHAAIVHGASHAESSEAHANELKALAQALSNASPEAIDSSLKPLETTLARIERKIKAQSEQRAPFASPIAAHNAAQSLMSPASQLFDSLYTETPNFALLKQLMKALPSDVGGNAKIAKLNACIARIDALFEHTTEVAQPDAASAEQKGMAQGPASSLSKDQKNAIRKQLDEAIGRFFEMVPSFMEMVPSFMEMSTSVSTSSGHQIAEEKGAHAAEDESKSSRSAKKRQSIHSQVMSVVTKDVFNEVQLLSVLEYVQKNPKNIDKAIRKLREIQMQCDMSICDERSIRNVLSPLPAYKSSRLTSPPVGKNSSSAAALNAKESGLESTNNLLSLLEQVKKARTLPLTADQRWLIISFNDLLKSTSVQIVNQLKDLLNLMQKLKAEHIDKKIRTRRIEKLFKSFARKQARLDSFEAVASSILKGIEAEQAAIIKNQIHVVGASAMHGHNSSAFDGSSHGGMGISLDSSSLGPHSGAEATAKAEEKDAGGPPDAPVLDFSFDFGDGVKAAEAWSVEDWIAKLKMPTDLNALIVQPAKVDESKDTESFPEAIVEAVDDEAKSKAAAEKQQKDAEKLKKDTEAAIKKRITEEKRHYRLLLEHSDAENFFMPNRLSQSDEQIVAQRTNWENMAAQMTAIKDSGGMEASVCEKLCKEANDQIELLGKRLKKERISKETDIIKNVLDKYSKIELQMIVFAYDERRLDPSVVDAIKNIPEHEALAKLNDDADAVNINETLRQAFIKHLYLGDETKKMLMQQFVGMQGWRLDYILKRLESKDLPVFQPALYDPNKPNARRAQNANPNGGRQVFDPSQIANHKLRSAQPNAKTDESKLAHQTPSKGRRSEFGVALKPTLRASSNAAGTPAGIGGSPGFKKHLRPVNLLAKALTDSIQDLSEPTRSNSFITNAKQIFAGNLTEICKSAKKYLISQAQTVEPNVKANSEQGVLTLIRQILDHEADDSLSPLAMLWRKIENVNRLKVDDQDRIDCLVQAFAALALQIVNAKTPDKDVLQLGAGVVSFFNNLPEMLEQQVDSLSKDSRDEEKQYILKAPARAAAAAASSSSKPLVTFGQSAGHASSSMGTALAHSSSIGGSFLDQLKEDYTLAQAWFDGKSQVGDDKKLQALATRFKDVISAYVVAYRNYAAMPGTDLITVAGTHKAISAVYKSSTAAALD